MLTGLMIGIHCTKVSISSPSPNFDMVAGLAGGVGGEFTRCDMIAAVRRSIDFTVKVVSVILWVCRG